MHRYSLVSEQRLKLSETCPQFDFLQLLHHLFFRCSDVGALSQKAFAAVDSLLHPEFDRTVIPSAGEVIEKGRPNVTR